APAQAAVAARIAKAPKKAWSPPPAKTPTIVLNGNGVSGSAGTASTLLGQRGYKMIQPPTPQQGNAPTFRYFQTEVYYDPAWGPGKLAAGGIGKLFGDANVAAMPADIVPLAEGARIVVVVGKTFHGTIATAPPPVIKHEAPHVRSALAETLPVVRAVRKQLPFRLAAPSVVDLNS